MVRIHVGQPNLKERSSPNQARGVKVLKIVPNELAAHSVKSLLLQTEMKAMMERMHAAPALPGEEYEFNNDGD